MTCKFMTLYPSQDCLDDLLDVLPIFCHAALLVACALCSRFLGLQGLGDKLFDILEDPDLEEEKSARRMLWEVNDYDAVLVGSRCNEMVQ